MRNLSKTHIAAHILKHAIPSDTSIAAHILEQAIPRNTNIATPVLKPQFPSDAGRWIYFPVPAHPGT